MRVAGCRCRVPPKIPPRLRDRWESLQVTVVHNTFSDREGSCHFTKEENQSYIDTDLDRHYFQNKKINNERFLVTWDVITQHCDTTIVPFHPTKGRKPTPPVRDSPEQIRITTEGEYILYLGGLPHKTTQNTLGELTIGDALEVAPNNIDPSPPTRWGKGFKGPRRECFPLPDEYALGADDTPLDQITVKTLTASFTAQLKIKPHPCLAAWEKRLPLRKEQWNIVASRYNNSLLTPSKGLPPPLQTHHPPSDRHKQ